MSDQVTAAVTAAVPGSPEQEYRSLIEEAFIAPIRTVIAVDDEFPSLDAVLSRFVTDGALWNGTQEMASVALGILDYCRRRQKPWLVDVHDGTVSDPQEIAIPQLHQSDLVILDYHLEAGDDGQKALTLLQSLANKTQFNMAVVYTKGNSDGIPGVFLEITAALTFATWTRRPQANRVKSANDAIKTWEELNPRITGQLNELISREIYLNERAAPGTARHVLIPRLTDVVNDAPDGLRNNPHLLYDWLLDQAHSKCSSLMSKQDLGPLAFALDRAGANWIRTDRLFVTVIDKKRKKPAELEAALLGALVKSAPSPLHLLMAKMIAQVDEKGADAQADVLRDLYLQAGWLSELFETEPADRKRLLKTTVTRHWDALGDNLRTDIDHYAGRLVEHVEARTKDQVIKAYVRDDIWGAQDKIVARLNAYNCTKSIDRSHITTGHILELPGSGKCSYWVCLSPACDLVPDQKLSGWRGKLGQFMPFTAVRLMEVLKETATTNASLNSYVFLRIGDQIKAFSFYPSPDPNVAPKADQALNPSWEQMFAARQGRFIEGSEHVEICRTSISADGALATSAPTMATVVAQLRYEYALNLLQRLGNSLSRVGLEFKAQAKPPVSGDRP